MLDRRLLATLLFGVVLEMAACSSGPKVASTRDPLVKFPERATVAWAGERSRLPADERIQRLELDAILREVAMSELAARGYRESTAPPSEARPDYLMSYELVATSVIRTTGSEALATLWLFLWDPASDQRVWAGSADGELLVSLGRDERTERIRGAVRRMLQEFPP